MSRETPFFRPGGTMDPVAPSYIERAGDARLLEALLAGEYVFVLDSRQKGKSSMVARTIVKLKEHAVRTVKLDLQRIGANVTPEQWYAGLLAGIGQELDLGTELFAFWESNKALGPLARWIGALEGVLVASLETPLVIFVDEVDFVRALPFPTDEFFGGIRDCYNRRSEGIGFERLTFCLVGVATPGQLVRNPKITPFNVGMRLELTDFTETETQAFAKALTTPNRDGSRLLARVHHWVSGHPYLTQLLCSHLAAHPEIVSAQGVDQLVRTLFLSPEARQQEPNFADVERRMLEPDVPGMTSEERKTQVLELYGRVLRGKRVEAQEENPVVATLRLSGVGSEDRGALRVRNRVYKSVFDEKWRVNGLPHAELRRQRGAARVAALRTAVVAAVVVLAVSTGAFGMWRLSNVRQQALRDSQAKAKELDQLSSQREAALTTLGRQSEDMKRVSEERAAALVTLEEKNKQLEMVSEERQDALAELRRQTGVLGRTSEERRQAIFALERKTHELERQSYVEQITSLRLGMAAGLWARAAGTLDQVKDNVHQGWELGYLKLVLGTPTSEYKFVNGVNRLEREPSGRLVATDDTGLYDLGPTGLKLRRKWNYTLSPDERKASEGKQWEQPSPIMRVGTMRYWLAANFGRTVNSVCDATTDETIIPARAGVWIVEVDPVGRQYLRIRSQAPGVIELRTIDGDKLLAAVEGQAGGLYFDGTFGTHEAENPAGCVMKRWSVSGTLLRTTRSSLTKITRAAESADRTRYALFGGASCEVRKWKDDSLVCVLPTQSEPITACQLSADGGKVFLGYESGIVNQFDAESGSFDHRIGTHPWRIRDIERTANGKSIAVFDGFGTLRTWSLAPRPAMETFSDLKSPISTTPTRFPRWIAYSPDNITIAMAGRGGEFITRNLKSGKLVRGVLSKPVTSSPSMDIVVDNKGRVLIGVGDGRVVALNANTLEEERVARVFDLPKDAKEQQVALTVLPGGRFLAHWQDEEGVETKRSLVDSKSLAVIARLKPNSMSSEALYQRPKLLPDDAGRFFVETRVGGRAVELHSAQDARLLRRWSTALPIWSICISPDGNSCAVVVAPTIEVPAKLEVYRLPDGVRTHSIPLSVPAYSLLSISKDGERLLGSAGRSGVAHLWNLKTGRLVAELKGTADAALISFSPDGERMVSTGYKRAVTVWDGQTGTELMAIDYQLLREEITVRDFVRFSGDGRRVILLGADAVLRVWNSAPWK